MDSGLKVTLGGLPEDPGFDWQRLTPDSRFGIGDIYVRAKRWDRAAGLIESLDDEPSMALLLQARLKLDQGDPAGALADYEEAFKTFPSNPAARYLAGRAAIETNDFEKGVNYYQDALRSDAAATDAGLVLGQMLLAEGRANYAMDTLGFYLVANANEPHAVRLLASTGASRGMRGFAENLRGILAEQPDWTGVALSDHALDIARNGAPDEALEYLDEGGALEDPNAFEAFTAWLVIARQAGREDVTAQYEKYQKQHAGTAGAAIIEARWTFENKDYAAALAAIDRALEMDPTLPAAHFQRGTALVMLDRIDDAIAAFDRARELDPLEARYALAGASTMVEAERFPEATERLRELLIHHPWFGRAALMLVELDRDHDVIETTLGRINYAKRAARLHRFERSRGARASSPGSISSARRIRGARYTKALNLGYRPSETIVGLARSLDALDRRDDAVAALESIPRRGGRKRSIRPTREPIWASSSARRVRPEMRMQRFSHVRRRGGRTPPADRRFACLVAGLFAFGLFGCSLDSSQEADLAFDSRPVGSLLDVPGLAERGDLNVLFVLIDTLRADRLGSYGYERDTSPVLDYVAATGLRFANHRAQSTWTKTSMASLWTSLYPQRTDVLDHRDAVSPEARMPAEVFAENGLDVDRRGSGATAGSHRTSGSIRASRST